MKKFVLTATTALVTMLTCHVGAVDFDYIDGEPGARVCVKLPHDSVKAVLYCHQNMTEEVLFRSERFCRQMDSLGVAMMFVQSGSQNWDETQGCSQRFDSIMTRVSLATGRDEIATAPVIPFGHSAQATFPWNFAAWNPQRTLCIISYHGDAPRTNLCGYGGPNLEWGRTRNIDYIPGLMIMGEYEWWESRLRPALAFRMMYPDSRVSFLCDAGRGHFDLCEETQDYIARFIAKTLDTPRPDGGVYYSRWSADGVESADPHDKFWYHDDEMVNLTRKRYQQCRDKGLQYLGAVVDGKTVPYDTTKHIKMNVVVDNDEFTVKPIFVDAQRQLATDAHASVTPRVVILSGPVIKTGEYTFKYDADYFGADPRRLWSGITLCLEAEGDDVYKPAVQEINIRLKNK